MRSSRRRSVVEVVSDEGSSEDDANNTSFTPRKKSRKRLGFASPKSSPIARGGVACPFPWKLHDMLDYAHSNGLEDTVAWDACGKSFAVFDSRAFVEAILPRFFSQTKYASFQRQLNLYGFKRVRRDNTSFYFHKEFVRGCRDLVQNMVRCKIKGTGKKRKHQNEDEEIHSEADEEVSRPGFPLVTPSHEVRSMDPAQQDESKWDEESLDGMTCEIDDLFDGDLLFFEGSPFHFLDAETVSTPWTTAPPFPLLPLSGIESDKTLTTLKMRRSPSKQQSQYAPNSLLDLCLNYNGGTIMTTAV